MNLRFLHGALILTALTTLVSSAPALAATLNAIAAESTKTLPPGGNGAVNLRLHNISDDPAQLVVWQVALVAMPDAGAVGEVRIESYSTPTDYVLGGLPSFGPLLAFGTEVPGVGPIFSDAVLSPPDAGLIAPQSHVGLVGLTVTASPDAAGQFRIKMAPLDGGFADSIWMALGDDVPRSFGNCGPDSDDAERTLVTIHVVPEPGAWTMGLTASMLTLGSFGRRCIRQVPRSRQCARHRSCDAL